MFPPSGGHQELVIVNPFLSPNLRSYVLLLLLPTKLGGFHRADGMENYTS